MLKMRLICLLIAGLLVSSTLAWAAPLQDYTICYTFKNPDGTVFRITKYYLRDGDKFRTDYISTVTYHVRAEAEASIDLSDDGNTKNDVRDGAELQAEYLTDAEPHTIEILRKDKGLVWTVDPNLKNYVQVPLRQDAWEHAVTRNFVPGSPALKKIGETKCLNYPCNIYEMEIKDWGTYNFVVAQGMNIILGSELRQNGKLGEIMEAMQLHLEKPAAALFEIPAGYEKQ